MGFWEADPDPAAGAGRSRVLGQVGRGIWAGRSRDLGRSVAGSGQVGRGFWAGWSRVRGPSSREPRPHSHPVAQSPGASATRTRATAHPPSPKPRRSSAHARFPAAHLLDFRESPAVWVMWDRGESRDPASIPRLIVSTCANASARAVAGQHRGPPGASATHARAVARTRAATRTRATAHPRQPKPRRSCADVWFPGVNLLDFGESPAVWVTRGGGGHGCPHPRAHERADGPRLRRGISAIPAPPRTIAQSRLSSSRAGRQPNRPPRRSAPRVPPSGGRGSRRPRRPRQTRRRRRCSAPRRPAQTR